MTDLAAVCQFTNVLYADTDRGSDDIAVHDAGGYRYISDGAMFVRFPLDAVPPGWRDFTTHPDTPIADPSIMPVKWAEWTAADIGGPHRGIFQRGLLRALTDLGAVLFRYCGGPQAPNDPTSIWCAAFAADGRLVGFIAPGREWGPGPAPEPWVTVAGFRAGLGGERE